MQPSTALFFILSLSFSLAVNAGPYVRRDAASLKNRGDTISPNAKFKALNPSSPCEADETGSPETTTNCMSGSENPLRILTTRAVPANDSSQSSLTLDPSVISAGFQKDGQDNITSPGQVASRTSSNNWINFCMTVDKPLTNGQQIAGGSCNPAPIGVIPSQDNMPSAKFIFPPNFAALAKNKAFTVQLAITHLEAGWFTNPLSAYMSSPVEVNANGDVIGHSHIVIQRLTGFGQTTPVDPKDFQFFKALNDPASANGVLSTNVTDGLPAGYYRISALHTATNHQPIAPPVAQHGAMGDMVYFSVI